MHGEAHAPHTAAIVCVGVAKVIACYYGPVPSCAVLCRHMLCCAVRCHPGRGGLSCIRSPNAVLAANYGSGSVAVFPTDDAGALQPATDSKQAIMYAADPGKADRQEGPHAHQIKLDPWVKR